MMTAAEAAAELRVSKKTILNFIQAGQFPNSFKTSKAKNGHWRIPRGDLENYKSRLTVSPWLQEKNPN
jgi:excisionase family DNA binding protein